MTKRVPFLLFVLIFFAKGYSQQSTLKPEWSFGVGAGPTFSTMSFVSANGKPSVDSKSALQYHGGISVRYISEKNLGFIVELNYAQQGWEEKFPQNLDNLQYSRTLNNIEIPFLTHIYFGDKTRFFINLGPKISYVVSESETMNKAFSDWIVTASTDTYMLDHYKTKVQSRFDYGLMGGLGMEFRTGIGNFSLEGRYYAGFGDIFKSTAGESFSRSANRVMTAKLTYYIKPF